MMYPSSDGSLQRYIAEALPVIRKEWCVKDICDEISRIGGTKRRQKIYYVLNNLVREGIMQKENSSQKHSLEKVYVFK